MARALTPRCLPLLTALWLVNCSQAQTFQLLSGWPQANGVVHAMAIDAASATLYLGGDFTTIDGQARQRLASIDLNTGALTNWAPSADNSVRAIVVAGDSVIVGGLFTTINTQPRSRLAALSPANGNVLPWSPQVNGTVNTIIANGALVCIGGSFSLVDATARLNAAAFVAATGTLDAWNPSVSGIVNSMSASASGVLIGGIFNSAGGSARTNAALVNSTSGAALPWTANTDAVVNVVSDYQNQTFLGGSFTQVSGTSRNGLGVVSSMDGLLSSWSPSFGGNVRALAITPQFAVAGGFYTTVNGSSHGNLAVIDRVSGLLIPGSPYANTTVNAVLLHDGKLFVAGAFTAINGSNSRNRFAVFSYCTESAWFADTDEDGLGDNGVMVMSCTPPAGFVADNSDCDDSDPDIGGPQVWYRDLDEDENGDHADSLVACTQPIGYVDNANDCDDSDAAIAMDNACDDGDPYTTSDAMLPWPDCGCLGLNLALSTRAVLEGAYDPISGLMRDDLRAAGLIPLTEPYSGLGYIPGAGSLPGTIVDPGVLAVTGQDAIVDWVILEVRDAVTGATAVNTRYALLQRDGDIVEPDGISPVRFPVGYGFYRLAVLHRNHMGVVTENPQYLESTSVDFSSPTLSVTGGTDARRLLAGVMLLRAGDTTFNDDIKYVGEGNDRDPILLRVGGSVPTASVPGYYTEDINLDGQVKYVGEANDRDPVLTTVGGSNPNAVRSNTYLRPTLP